MSYPPEPRWAHLPRREEPAAPAVTAAAGAQLVRPVWDSLPVTGRREVIGIVAEIGIGKASRRMSRWATDEDRLEVAAEQIGVSRWSGDEHTWAELWKGHTA